jgi:hypothetical protein
VFIALSAALVTYGLLLSSAVASGAWFRHTRASVATPAKLPETGVQEVSS